MMVSFDEFGQLVSEFESFRDFVLDELKKISSRFERLEDDFQDLKKELFSK